MGLPLGEPFPFSIAMDNGAFFIHNWCVFLRKLGYYYLFSRAYLPDTETTLVAAKELHIGGFFFTDIPQTLVGQLPAIFGKGEPEDGGKGLRPNPGNA